MPEEMEKAIREMPRSATLPTDKDELKSYPLWPSCGDSRMPRPISIVHVTPRDRIEK